MIERQVVCIRKLDRVCDFRGITHLDVGETLLGRRMYTRDEVIRMIENNECKFFTEFNCCRVYLRVVTKESGKYVRTDPDDQYDNNLLSLPQC